MKIIALLLLLGLSAAAEPTGLWMTTIEASKSGHDRNVFCDLPAKTSVVVGGKKFTPGLLIRWYEDDLDFQLCTEFGVTAGVAQVEYQYDQAPPVNAKWQSAEDCEAAFAPGLAHVTKMLTAQALAIKIHSASGEEIKMEFDVRGLVTAMRPIAPLLPDGGKFATLKGFISKNADENAPLKPLPGHASAVVATEPLPTDSAENGKWTLDKRISKIDDTPTFIWRLVAEHPVKVGYRTSEPNLVVRWKEGKLSAFVNTDFFLGIDKMLVTSRFDKKPAQTLEWSIATDSKGVFAPGTFLEKEILASQSLVVRLTPYGESPVEIEFDVRGLREIAPQLPKFLAAQDANDAKEVIAEIKPVVKSAPTANTATAHERRTDPMTGKPSALDRMKPPGQ